jgi:hypothetical protein
MSAPSQQSQAQENKPSDKELNFRALEAKLAQERAGRLEAEKKAIELANQYRQAPQQQEEPEHDDEPYVDHKNLAKKLQKFGQSTKTEIEKAMEIAKEKAKDELKQEMWLENNPDFYDVLQHAEKFAQKAPKLAENILRMPEGFERQKLVYHNIKELGIDKPEQKSSGIQETIDAKKRGPYYQPTGIGTPAAGAMGDFSDVGQKNAYAKMQELKKRLRMYGT